MIYNYPQVEDVETLEPDSPNPINEIEEYL
jgi:hypothetical protein